MGNIRRISKKYYVRQIVTCMLVYFMLLGMPVQIALAGIGDGGWTTPEGTPLIDALGGTANANITLNDLQTIINWNNFDTIDTQSVTFLQNILGNPAVLNRVTGGLALVLTLMSQPVISLLQGSISEIAISWVVLINLRNFPRMDTLTATRLGT